jgi:hypothetical protein
MLQYFAIRPWTLFTTVLRIPTHLNHIIKNDRLESIGPLHLLQRTRIHAVRTYTSHHTRIPLGTHSSSDYWSKD